MTEILRTRVPGCALALLALAGAALAGGTSDHVVLLVDPTDPESLYLANVYRDARGVPAANVLTMTPWTDGEYPELTERNLPALRTTLDARGIEDHVDFVLLMPTRETRVRASSLVSDTCSNVSHFALSSAYTMAFMTEEILAGGLPSTEPNRYYAGGTLVRPFDGATSWASGVPSTGPSARRYLIGATLGWTGDRGNTVDELVALVRRSAAADGTRPSGTYYFMETKDSARSGPRDWAYPSTVAELEAIGSAAVHLQGTLPDDATDCLGVMTGVPNVDPVGRGVGILPGAFCDHLTSYAGLFTSTGQTQVSKWITAGASGSAGAVEEPCNYAGKFPHPRIHVYYAQGTNLGEAYFRSARYVPFQIMLYGDPLTRAHAWIPEVTVDGMPPGDVSGLLELIPTATTDRPATYIAGFDLHVDGRLVDSTGPTGRFAMDTRDWNDGRHELRILARDDSDAASVGRWIGAIDTRNRGHAATIAVHPTTGDLGTAFRVDLAGTGRTVREIRVLHNGRVVAAAETSPATLTVHGHLLGAGPVVLQAEAMFEGGRRARSAPIEIDIAYAGGGSGGSTPIAYGYTKVLPTAGVHAVELPSTHADSPADATYEIVTAPAHATVLPGTTAGFRLLSVPTAEGADSMTFRVTTPSGTSSVASVRLIYGEEEVEPDPVPDPETLDLVITRGDLKDKLAAGKDRLQLKGTLAFLPASLDGEIDPSSDTVTVVVRSEVELYRLEIPAGDVRWAEDGGVWTWKSPSGVRPKVKLKLAASGGPVKLKVRKLDLPPVHVGPVEVALGSGADRGSHEAPWTETKPGRLKLR